MAQEDKNKSVGNAVKDWEKDEKEKDAAGDEDERTSGGAEYSPEESETK